MTNLNSITEDYSNRAYAEGARTNLDWLGFLSMESSFLQYTMKQEAFDIEAFDFENFVAGKEAK